MSLARKSLADYVELTCQFRLEPWQRQICERLERLKDERGQKLLIHAPPQYGKSIIVSQRFPSWLIGADPTHRVRLACYNVSHAIRFSKVNLAIMRMPEYRAVFSGPEAQVPSICPAEEWSVPAREALHDGQASFLAMGLGSGFTGQGSDTLIIDDPYKNRDEAYSETIRENIWQWWAMTAKPRTVGANIVVMFHRWHLDDLAGRLMQEGDWELMTFPAIADDGSLLTPRVTREWLEEYRAKDATAFQALYQGKPVPDGGALVKAHWWRYWYPAGMPEPEPIRAVLADGTVHTCIQAPLPERFDEIAQSWDLGFVGSDTADFAAGGIAGRLGANVFIVDERHQRCDLPEAEDLVKGMSEQYPGGYTKLIEYKALGPRVIARLQGQIPGFLPIHPDGDKKARLQAVLPRIRSGNVYLPHPALYPWVSEYRGELETFPVGANDDRVDWTSQLLSYFEAQDWSSIVNPPKTPEQVAQEAAKMDEAEFEAAFMRVWGDEKGKRRR